jgi:hypothetical protein
VNPLDAGIIGTSLVTVACTGGNLFAVLRGKPGLAGAFCVLAGVSQLILAVLDALGGARIPSAFAAAAAVFWFWLASRYWRKRRKRSLRALGAKAKARLAAMVKNMPKPGPVLRPVPQGA